jgi:phosphoadenosine phosphosulfate reductase
MTCRSRGCRYLGGMNMVVDVKKVDELAIELDDMHPRDILAFACREYDRIAFSFSGAEDIVLLDMAVRGELPLRVFSLDTGRLHAETYHYFETIRNHYGVAIQTFFPDPTAVEALVNEKGYFSFYVDGHEECCSIRKVEPMRRALRGLGLDAYVTGQRRDQSPTRQLLPVLQVDQTFSTPEHEMVKFNPLAGWTSDQVWAYIAEYQVPYNPLHDRGFRSIGCEPCTRATNPGEHERAGRWWWEEATQRECGLHIINLRTPSK